MTSATSTPDHTMREFIYSITLLPIGVEPLPNEFDRVTDVDHGLLPASTSMQQEYWLARARLAAAVATYWQDILDACPEIAQHYAALNAVKRSHPSRSFHMFPPEITETVDFWATNLLPPPYLR